MKFRIYYDATDAGGIVYHTEYIKFCEEARSEIFFKNNIFFEKEGFVVTELHSKFIASAKLADIIEVKTKVKKISKVSVILFQEIFKEDKLIYTQEVKLAFLKNNKISKIPEKYIKILNEYKS